MGANFDWTDMSILTLLAYFHRTGRDDFKAAGTTNPLIINRPAMENFTPYSALAGGALIGLASALLMLLIGRIAGISGIIGNAFPPYKRSDVGWSLFFLVGLLLGPLSARLINGDVTDIRIDTPLPVLIIAGLLVGYGTGLGGGCTSGHGVCGQARLSPRSLTATLAFMVVAGITVYIVRHLLVTGD
jgi:uncharacterized membrane protein YedE/YeeE